MNEISIVILSFTGGAMLGIIFFGGLWLTVKKVVVAKTPVLWVFGSFFLRMSIVLVGFYFIASSNWQRLLGCMLGFIAARFIVMYYTKAIDERKLKLTKEDIHEA